MAVGLEEKAIFFMCLSHIMKLQYFGHVTRGKQDGWHLQS